MYKREENIKIMPIVITVTDYKLYKVILAELIYT